MSSIVSLSVSALTTRAAIVASLAVVVMLVVGWRKPARAEPRAPRTRRAESVERVAVDHLPAPMYRRPGLMRRLAALVTSGALSIIAGVLIAIVIAFTFSAAVIYLTNLLDS